MEFVGQGANGSGTIAAGAVGSLGLHGRLNSLANDTDVADELDNCADVVVANDVNGAGASAFITCAQLAVESPNLSVGGGKSTSQTEIPPDTPITFTLQSANNGNLPIASLVLLDPADPAAAGNPFDVVRLERIDASVDPTSTGLLVEVYDPTAGAYVPYVATDAALLERSRGARASIVNTLPPGGRVTLDRTTAGTARRANDTRCTNRSLRAVGSPLRAYVVVRRSRRERATSAVRRKMYVFTSQR